MVTLHLCRGRGLQEHIKSDLAPYDIWEKKRKVDNRHGGVGVIIRKTTYLFIVKRLEELIEKYDLKLKAIGYDSHNADGFLSSLDIFGCPLVEIKQSARFLNDATSDLQLLIKQGDVEYDKGNGCLYGHLSMRRWLQTRSGKSRLTKEQGNETNA